jgi:hypothetical protein
MCMKAPVLPVLLAAMTMILGGCAVVAVDDPYGDYYDAPAVYTAPPPPRYEYIGAPPVAGHIWVGGYWDWVGSRYHWVSGRWEAPRPGYLWSPFRWERNGDHWRRHGGRWDREGDFRPLPRPVPRDHHPRYEPGRRAAPPDAPRLERPERPERPFIPNIRPSPPMPQPNTVEPDRGGGREGRLQRWREHRDEMGVDRESREREPEFRPGRRP